MAHISNLITLEWSWGVAAPAVGYDIDEKLGGEDCDQLRIRGLLTRPAARRRPPACAASASRLPSGNLSTLLDPSTFKKIYHFI
jgi:hypothetical protein